MIRKLVSGEYRFIQEEILRPVKGAIWERSRPGQPQRSMNGPSSTSRGVAQLSSQEKPANTLQ